MKKQLITLTTTLLIASSCISQTSSDTTVSLPITQLKKAINLIEKGKVMEQELILSKESIAILESRIVAKDSIYNLFKLKEQSYLSIFDNLKKNISNSDEIISNLENQLKLEGKRLKRQKLSKWAALITGLSIGFIITK
jgi:hypothetical protein